MANNSPKELATKKKTSCTVKSTKSSSNKSSKKLQKSVSKNLTKELKKNPIALICGILFLVIGSVLGIFGYKLITTNDKYFMNDYQYTSNKVNTNGETARELYGDMGSEVAILFVEEEYVELGVTCICFGVDKSQEVTTKYYYREDISYDAIEVNSIDTSISGFYYVCYFNDTLKYSNVELIRNVIVVEVENNG